MNRKPLIKDTRTGTIPSDQRRSALRKLAGVGALSGVVASMPNGWVKPVIDTVLLPAHACTTEGCPAEPPTLRANVVNVTVPNPSGNIGTFDVTITSPDADAAHPITINSVTPSSGSIQNFTPGTQVTSSSPLVLKWVSPPGFVDGTTGIVLANMFADLTVGVSGADKSQFIFTLAEAGDSP